MACPAGPPTMALNYYRSPIATTDSLQSLHSAVSTVSTFLPNIVCGDFNVPDIDWSTISPKH